MIISNTCVVKLSQLLEWKTKLLQAKKEALDLIAVMVRYLQEEKQNER